MKFKDLDQVLHFMSGKKGIVVWDSIWGTFLGFFLLLLACAPLFPKMKVGVVLMIALVLLAILAAGHIIGFFIWKKRSFIPKFLKHNKGIVETVNEQYYLELLNQDVREALLYYSKTWILTRNYMIGNADTDIAFVPVAIPREHIKKIVFFERKIMERHRKYSQGILKCLLYAGKEVEYVIGQRAEPKRVLEVLERYEIPFEYGETQTL